ncbi:MAG TPA: zinc ribbon domain-containing protein [Candidatus Limnocylindrales bacterium]|nr:zinc ribbon domain-containing protein [Candidatus Limnocylindrales bacterium]
MFEDLFAEVDAALSGFVESDVFQVGIRVLVAYIVLIWLASAFWAYRDMRLRSASAFTPYVAAAAIIVFTPIFFLFGLLIYRIVRPKETIAEVNERTLAEEAMLAEIASHTHCANCSRPVHEDWIICPTCRNRLRRVCPNCEHLIELDWTLCAWCGKDFERAEAPGLAAYMPSARPASRAPQSTVWMPPVAPLAPPAPTPISARSAGSPGPAVGSTAPLPPTRSQASPVGGQATPPPPRSSGAAPTGAPSSGASVTGI